MLEVLLLLPVCMGMIMLFLPLKPKYLRGFLLLTSAGHIALTTWLVYRLCNGHTPTAFNDLLKPDPLGALFLGLASVLFLAASVYAIGYLQEEHIKIHKDIQDKQIFTNAPEQRFTACMCFFLAAMTLVTLTPHLGLLWVGIELTTLSSAPLIYFHRHQRSLEATWKYLMICSVGIALALLGNLLLNVAFLPIEIAEGESLDQLHQFLQLSQAVNSARIPWLKAGFIFLLVGYGTKMGLAPLHNWLPDAHSEAPSVVSALLSGALLNCAFLGILRGHQIMQAAHLGSFSSNLLVFFGVFSMIIASIFIVGQGHYKRLLAYSSVEHMGILALGVGIGGLAIYGALFHAVLHSLTKCMLFLLAGNILTRYHTLSSHDVHGMHVTMPATAFLWVAGFLAIVGSPPFGLFVSEFSILKGILDSSHAWIAALYLGALTIIFIGMSIPVFHMVQGTRPRDIPTTEKESCLSLISPALLGLAVLIFGIYMPEWLKLFLDLGVKQIGGSHVF